MKMIYCDNCKQNVKPHKEFDFCLFLILCLTIIGGVIYVFYPKKLHCPICKGIIPKENLFKNDQPIEPPQQTPIPQVQTPQFQPAPIKLKVCSYCGDRIRKEAKYCDNCGSKQ